MPETLPPPTFGPTRKTRKPRATAAEKERAAKLGKYHTALRGYIEGAASTVKLFSTLRNDPALESDAVVLAMSADDLAEPLSEAIEGTPVLAAYMDRAKSASPWLKVGAVVLGIGLAITANHHPVLRERLGGALGGGSNDSPQ